MQQNFQNAEQDRIILPDGQTLVWNEQKKKHIPAEKSEPDLTTVHREDTLTSDGNTVFAQRTERKIPTPEAVADAEWHKTSATLARLARRLSWVFFWGFVAIFLKMIIAVGDMFVDYAAKGVAQGIGKGIQTVVDVLVWLIALTLIFVFGTEFFGKKSKPQVEPKESNAIEIPTSGTGHQIIIAEKVEFRKAPESDAQSILNG